MTHNYRDDREHGHQPARLPKRPKAGPTQGLPTPNKSKADVAELARRVRDFAARLSA